MPDSFVIYVRKPALRLRNSPFGINSISCAALLPEPYHHIIVQSRNCNAVSTGEETR